MDGEIDERDSFNMSTRLIPVPSSSPPFFFFQTNVHLGTL